MRVRLLLPVQDDVRREHRGLPFRAQRTADQLHQSAYRLRLLVDHQLSCG